MTSTQNLRPGQEVTFTQFGRKGVRTGTLSGIEVTWTNELVAWIRPESGNVISVPVNRVSAA